MSEAQVQSRPVETAPKTIETWAVVELMGHVKMAGRLSEVQRFGAAVGLLEVPEDKPAGFRRVFFSGASVYRIQEVSEQIARIVAHANPVGVVDPYDLRQYLLDKEIKPGELVSIEAPYLAEASLDFTSPDPSDFATVLDDYEPEDEP